MRNLILLACLTLMACATEQERCVDRSTRDLEIVNGLIEETERNIDRGYALRTERDRVRVGIGVCTGFDNGRFCTSTRTVDRRVPVAIDLADERAKLDSLVEKRDELRREAVVAIRACRAAG